MPLKRLACGPYANESERTAAEKIAAGLRKRPSAESWVVLSNVLHSLDIRHQSDEIDLLVIGPPGVSVIEVKHWSRKYLDREPDRTIDQAQTLARKVRKIATRAREVVPDIGFLPGKFLLTNESRAFVRDRPKREGAEFFALTEWKALLGVDNPAQLSREEIDKLAHVLQPRTTVALEGDLQRLGGIHQLERISPPEDRFHRIYRGRDATTREQVVLHLYDLSAYSGVGDDPELLARREFEVLQRLQKSPWLPGFQVSFREVPGYPGELYYFAMIDPAAPTLEDRREDETWPKARRLEFAKNCATALAELHNPTRSEIEGLCHRKLSPLSILVRADDRPLLTDFALARVPGLLTIAPAVRDAIDLWKAPEVLTGGLAAATQASDVFSLCRSLEGLLSEGPEAEAFNTAIKAGLAENPDQRVSARTLEESLSLLDQAAPAPATPLPPARYWSEDLVVEFNHQPYRIVSKLGEGGMGITFKVVQEGRDGESYGTYVGKVIHDPSRGETILRAYARVRTHTTKSDYLTILQETAGSWNANSFIALLGWVDGVSLADIIGELEEYADFEEEEPEALLLHWLECLTEGLAILHRGGLVHGDVSPRNVLINRGQIRLTDFDLVHRFDERMWSPGTPAYHAPELIHDLVADPSHDVYALGGTLFHVLTGQEPFRRSETVDKASDLAWGDFPSEKWLRVRRFLERANATNRSDRFRDAVEAQQFLQALQAAEAVLLPTPEVDCPAGPFRPVTASPSAMETATFEPSPNDASADETPADHPVLIPNSETAETSPPLADSGSKWTPNEVIRLKSILQLYPGGQYGCVETRGLDSEFAADTYVETGLEAHLLKAIRDRRARLIILCGNAGDGKTAMLQYLAGHLGLPVHTSAQRLWDEKIPGGPRVRVNLDGSAAFQGRSADELLNEFFNPFLSGPSEEDIVHLLAINDGRLLSWLTTRQGAEGQSFPLIEQLSHALLTDSVKGLPEYVSLIDLNGRSLVGGYGRATEGEVPDFSTAFFDELIDKLLGGEQSAEVWAPCQTCTARQRCQARRSAELLLDRSDKGLGRRVLSQLARALQGVHQRGEVHITTRELRAALSYILFGVYYCNDLHQDSQLEPPSYFDLAFDGSPNLPYPRHDDSEHERGLPAMRLRPQGELLRALAWLDPAIQSNAKLDRYLVGQPRADRQNPAPRYPTLAVASARRRAYFEWSEDQVKSVGGDSHALALARGRHLDTFRHVPVMSEAEQRTVCRDLCQGISRLEELPRVALGRDDAVILKIAPRTPIETALWIERPAERFRLECPKASKIPGLETLHTHLNLVYDAGSGRTETLRMGSELFHILLELREGYQLADVLSDDTFANLTIFRQRLAQHDGADAAIYAWNPVEEDLVYEVKVVPVDGVQQLRLKSRTRQDQ